jgi:hypothetical protein
MYQGISEILRETDRFSQICVRETNDHYDEENEVKENMAQFIFF